MGVGVGAVEGAGLPVLAVTLPQFTGDPGPALEACVDARRVGFGGAFVFDHFWPLGGPRTRPALECWTLLAAVAAEAGRQPGGGFRVGTLVTRAGLRAPAVVARMAATVGEVAGVPPIVGVGRGDVANRAENLAFGLPFGDAAERARAVEDTVAALRGPLAAGRRAGTAPPDPRAARGVGGWQRGRGAGAGRAGRGRLERVGAHAGGAGRGAGRGAGGGRGGRSGPGRRRRLLGRAGAGGGRAAGGRGPAGPLGEGRPPAELARVVAGDPDTVLARLRALGDAGAAWCVLATVGGPGAEARALLADAAGLPGRQRIG